MKHLKIMSNDAVLLDETIEACAICPLYGQCWYRMNDKEYLSSFTFPKIAPTCPLEDTGPLDECKHEWVYAGYTFATCPPVTPRICRKCGKREDYQYPPTINEYDELVIKFRKDQG